MGPRLGLLVAAGAFIALAAVDERAGAAQTGGGGQPAAATAQGEGEVVLVPVQGNVYLLVGAGANITVQIGPPSSARPRLPASAQERGEYGVLLVDTGTEALAPRALAAIRAVSKEPIRYILNTHAHDDHVGGNAVFARPASGGRGGPPPPLVLAHETVLLELSTGAGGRPPAAEGAWPTDAYLDLKEFWFNDESIQVFHQPGGHTDGDSIVYFRRSDVVSAGDIFMTTRYPFIDRERGGTINGVIDGLNRILDLTIVSNNAEGGTRVIPGHGRISDEADVVEYRNMLVIIRDRIKALVDKGMTLAQVKAARPSLDYDYRYGASTGPWTTDQFIETIYTDLAKNKPAVRGGNR